MTAADLAARFGISDRTVYRDIRTLNARGAVIAGEAGVGFVLAENFFIPPLAFDGEEAAALLLGLRFVSRRGDAALVEAADRARGKLAAALPSLFGDAGGFRQPLVVAPGSSGQENKLAAIRDALSRERKLRIRYIDRTGNPSARIVWPVVLGWFDGMEMLAAWCELRGAFRNFRIDRIEKIEPVDERPARARHALLAEFRRLEPDVSL